MKIIKTLLVTLLLTAVVAGIAGCSGTSGEAADTTRIGTVERGDLLLDISAAGNLALSHTEDLVVDLFYQQGTIAEVLVEEGDSVTEGQVLVEIDADEWQEHIDVLEDAVNTARRLVETRERALATAERLVTTREQALSTAERLVTTREIQLREAELNLEAAQYNLETISEVKEVQDRIDLAEDQLVFIGLKLIESRSAGANPLDWTFWASEKNRVEQVLADAIVERNAILTGNSLNVTTTAAQEVTRRQLAIESAELAQTAAQAAITDALWAGDEAEVALASARTDVEYAREDVVSAQEDTTDAAEALNDALVMSPAITAPFDGFITGVNVEGGDEVIRGTVAVQIADPDKFEANILVSEMDILQVEVGGTATILADAISGMVFPATVTRVAPTATIQSGVVNYRVTVELQSLDSIAEKFSERRPGMLDGLESGELPERLQQAVDDGTMTEEQARQMMERLKSGDFSPPEGFTPPEGMELPGEGFRGGVFGDAGTGRAESQLPAMTLTGFQLRQGLTVTVSIIVAERTDVLLVPNGAVIQEGLQSYVEVVTASGDTEKRAVQVGLSDWQYTEIISGLTEGEEIIVPLNVSSSTSTETTGGGFRMFGGPR
ncbi:MAG: HlyD family efflux transporter periplasmic adaptor subunit [Dehalococcoidales bacterium]|nr:HlyD family efflux transporter periplasmic adaptor subunit [Dehalococcoidales bacterium]